MGKGKRGRIRRKGSGLCHLSLCHTPLPNCDSATTALEQLLTCQALAIPKVFLHPLPLLWGIPAYLESSCSSFKSQHNILWRTYSLPPSIWQVPHYSPWQHPPFFIIGYQSYSVQISLCVYMYNVIFSIDNTVCKEDHWFFTTVVQHTAQSLAQYMVGAQ